MLVIRNELNRGGTNVSAQQLVDMVNNSDAVVLDLRDQAEFEQGHIVDSLNIPFANLESRIDELTKYKDKPIVLACKMGQHAGSAGAMLRKAGYENVSRLRGGITEWRGQSMPVVKS